MSHVENINQIINENSSKTPKEIAKLINKYCLQNPSINEIESRTLNENIKLDGYNFAKTKNIVRIKAKSKNNKSTMRTEAKQTKEKLKEVEVTLAELMKYVVELSEFKNLDCRPIQA